MQSYPRLLGIVATLSLGFACGGSIGTINYEPRAPNPPPRAKTEIAMYDIDCREPVVAMSDCTYNGAAVNWQVIGAFHTPVKAAAKWGKYRSDVLQMASVKGCPAVAMRRVAPSNTGSEPIGAFCVDPAATGDAGTAPPPGGPGIGVSGTATVAPVAHECNSNNDCPPGVKCTRGTCHNE
jgi:hypothetical protein